MTRDHAERLVQQGEATWDGSTLVLNDDPRPLVSASGTAAVQLGTPSERTRISWPGWMRTRSGEWIRAGGDA